MLKLFKTILKAGEPTVKYPFAPLDISPDFRGRPELDPQQCIACAACTMACPANALTMETHPESNERIWQLFIGRCIFCGRCEEVCPTKAIRLTNDFELAVTNKADLYVKAVFRLQHCDVCKLPFTPEKSAQYAVELLRQSGVSDEALAGMSAQFTTCPACKRQRTLSQHDRQMFSSIGAEKSNERV
ncbi:hydrogenase 4 subunit H [Scandinavium sp. H11S7]|uniref:Hydrogenase 4 subunit H n=1 Tax=Scandinavium hiltneri TaxID=2926519 RepID=A0ABT2DYZ7_9ENTR|nr:hydrogenase 4 subunit H [Scandinavium hiltneri]MCS2155699.1 hydrogenase 4 subunit H [Scandinavium hiltneri]MCS2160020.1 hydrogenase 4 subunit H [Scandinavium hiltneri]